MFTADEIVSDGVRFIPAGDTALVIEFGNVVDLALNARVLKLHATIEQEHPAGVLESVPTFRSLLVHYDTERTDFHTLAGEIVPLLNKSSPDASLPRTWQIPVCYGEDFAPDLAAVADWTGLSKKDVVEKHCSELYHVFFLGFLPGCALLGNLVPELETKRRKEPRVKVPAGSVAIAMRLTIVYPLFSPGGWNLIGNCPVRFFDHRALVPSLLSPGDKVTFQPISPREHAELLALESETFPVTRFLVS